MGINTATSAPVTILEGNTFNIVVGEAERHSNYLQINRLEIDRALVTKRIMVKADEYPFVEVSVDCHHADLRMFLVWRSSADAGKLSNTPVPFSGSESATILIHGKGDWSENITEIGVDVYGDLRGCPLRVMNVSLLPYTPMTLLLAIYSEWTAFDGWNQTSINIYTGTPRERMLYPTLAVVAWLILSFSLATIFFHIVNLTKRRGDGLRQNKASQLLTITIIIGVSGWLSLDALWLYKSTLQAAETRHRFAGKTLHEKKNNDWDRDIYSFAYEIKSKLLIPKGELVSLYYEEEDKAITGRLRYHLLPEFRVSAPRKLVNRHRGLVDNPGDYLIVLASNEKSDWSNWSDHIDTPNGEELDMLYATKRLALFKARNSKNVEEKN